MRIGRWRVRRERDPAVRNRPLWDAPCGEGALLWERAGVPRLDARRRAGARADAIAQEMARDLATALALVVRQERAGSLWLGGGVCAALPSLGAAIREQVACPVALDTVGAFVGERGGLALGGPDALVVDLGQTAVKASMQGRRATVPRDVQRLPLRLIGTPRPTGAAREALRSEVAQLVAAAASSVAAPSVSMLVLAMPCPLDDDAIPGPCTYGWDGDRDLVPAVLHGLEPLAGRAAEALLLNDAELAALTARARLPPTTPSPVLCVTLGFGPGGALLELAGGAVRAQDSAP